MQTIAPSTSVRFFPASSSTHAGSLPYDLERICELILASFLLLHQDIDSLNKGKKINTSICFHCPLAEQPTPRLAAANLLNYAFTNSTSKFIELGQHLATTCFFSLTDTNEMYLNSCSLLRAQRGPREFRAEEIAEKGADAGVRVVLVRTILLLGHVADHHRDTSLRLLFSRLGNFGLKFGPQGGGRIRTVHSTPLTFRNFHDFSFASGLLN